MFTVFALFLAGSVQAALFGANTPSHFREPPSKALDHVNPMIGNGGDSPNGSGGMIPSTGPPFAMTRWVAQTRQNYVSVTPYNETDTKIHGFQGTHQPAIWMGESGQVVVTPVFSNGAPKPAFEERGLDFDKATEVSAPSYYSATLEDQNHNIVKAEMSSSSRVGHLRFTFTGSEDGNVNPGVIVQATRAYVLGSSDPANTTSPLGDVHIDTERREISGRNPERQDHIIGPDKASNFAGYFVTRFDKPFISFGTASNATLHANEKQRTDKLVSAYVNFAAGTRVVDVRVGVSFISIDQARRNLEKEIPDGQSLESTARATRSQWAEKLDRIQLEGGSDSNKTAFYTAFFHSLQYPYEQSEDGQYYSGYDEKVHSGISYTGYSIWDIYRAEWAWLILFAPERIGNMITSMLQDYQQGGWLPMWKNIVETNIMIGTHADSLIAEALLKNITDFDLSLAYAAVHKDATVPPDNDATTKYSDRQENVGYEVRAGLSTVYAQKGWVADDIHSESASRTLAYAFDDHATSVVAQFAGKAADQAFFSARSRDYGKIFNNQTGFIEARNASGSWAGPDNGWTEGDKWAYTFDVVHDIPGLIQLKGGNNSFIDFLDSHFDGGHNDHTNEPSHHIPYLYTLAGDASKTQIRVREIASTNYNDTPNGLSGNEDCGQMSAWYLFSALGFYPVNPASTEYVVGSPFFERVQVKLPLQEKSLVVKSSGASQGKIYIKALSIDGNAMETPIISHDQILNGGTFDFKMASTPQSWGSSKSGEGPLGRHQEL